MTGFAEIPRQPLIVLLIHRQPIPQNGFDGDPQELTGRRGVDYIGRLQLVEILSGLNTVSAENALTRGGVGRGDAVIARYEYTLSPRVWGWGLDEAPSNEAGTSKTIGARAIPCMAGVDRAPVR